MSDDDLNAANQQVLEDPDESTLRIMLSTDNHLGYAERDPVRGMDSFAAFEEVLYLAKRFRCDMVLLAGDLFHDNRPSRRTLYKTMEIMKRYCMGPDPVRFQILSDQSKNFHASGKVNYQDENFSVDLPIFSIHGNHDDPTREGGELLAALDLLAISNLVNYFGRQEEVDKIEVSPILIAKGTTHVALYGLGSLRDERLNRMWRSKKVRFLRPAEDADDDEDGFFNILTLHQNRDLGRGAKNCIQESLLPAWMDIVNFGHEHECLIEFSESVVGTFRITQPGSSVATSLVSGEAVRKKVGILDIRDKKFKLHPVPLTQVRAFVTSEISLKEHRGRLDADDPKIDEKIQKVLEEEVQLMKLNAREKAEETLQAARAAGNNAGDENSPLRYRLEKPSEVLIRLRVEHSGFATVNNQRFGARFVGEVANPSDILLFRRQKDINMQSQAAKKRFSELRNPIAPDELERTNMEDLVKDFLTAPEQKLKILAENELSVALESYVDKNLGAAIPDAAYEQLKKMQERLRKNKDDAGGEIEKASQVRDIIESEFQGKKEKEASQQNNAPASRSNKGPEKAKDVAEREKETAAEGQARNPSSNKAAASSATTRTATTDASQKATRRKRALEFDDEDDLEYEMDVSAKGGQKKGAVKNSRRPARTAAKRTKSYALDSDDGGDDSDAIVLDTSASEEVGNGVSSKSARRRSQVGRTKLNAKKAPKTTTTRQVISKRAFEGYSDDDAMYGGASGNAALDDDWGTANTRSQK